MSQAEEEGGFHSDPDPQEERVTVEEAKARIIENPELWRVSYSVTADGRSKKIKHSRMYQVKDGVLYLRVDPTHSAEFPQEGVQYTDVTIKKLKRKRQTHQYLEQLVQEEEMDVDDDEEDEDEEEDEDDTELVTKKFRAELATMKRELDGTKYFVKLDGLLVPANPASPFDVLYPHVFVKIAQQAGIATAATTFHLKVQQFFEGKTFFKQALVLDKMKSAQVFEDWLKDIETRTQPLTVHTWKVGFFILEKLLHIFCELSFSERYDKELKEELREEINLAYAKGKVDYQDIYTKLSKKKDKKKDKKKEVTGKQFYGGNQQQHFQGFGGRGFGGRDNNFRGGFGGPPRGGPRGRGAPNFLYPSSQPPHRY